MRSLPQVPAEVGPRPDELRQPADHAALNITKRCNQRCVFCFEGTRASWDEPSPERVRAMLRESARAGHDEVIFMGAEALLRPDILDVLRYARSLGLRNVAVFTNGQALARDGFVAELVEAGLSSMQVSVHHADAETFARVARVSPRMFDRAVRGLENVEAYNRRARRDGSPALAVAPKTILLSTNYGRLAEIRRLLEATLGESFDNHMISSAFPSASADEYLLEPFAGRREELLDCLSKWSDRVQLVFSMVPLCLIPGYEHLSFDPKIVVRGARIDSNFVDKRRLDEMHRYVTYYRDNPYRWVCRDCRLLPLCPTVRTSAAFPAYAPHADQRFLPDGAADPDAIVRRIVGDDPAGLAEAAEKLRARWKELAEVPVPEHALLTALRGLALDGAEIVEATCGDPALLSFSVRVDGLRFPVSISLPRRSGKAGSLVGYLCVELDAGDVPMPGHVRRRVLSALGSLELPPLSDWRGFRQFDAVATTIAGRLSAALGDLLWPDQHDALGATASELTFGSDGTGRLRLSRDARASIELELQWTPKGVRSGERRVPLVATSEGLAVHVSRSEGAHAGARLELVAAALAAISARAARGGARSRATTFGALLLRARAAFGTPDFVAPLEARAGAALTGMDELSPLAVRMTLVDAGRPLRVVLRPRAGGAKFDATAEGGGAAEVACARALERIVNLEGPEPPKTK